MKLVERQPRGGALTPAGEFLANHVLRAQALLVQAARGVAEFRQPAIGALSVVASGVPGTYLLPEVVATFRREHPGVRISLEMATSARAVDSLRSHRAEVRKLIGLLERRQTTAVEVGFRTAHRVLFRRAQRAGLSAGSYRDMSAYLGRAGALTDPRA